MTTGSRFVLPFWTIIDMIGGVLPGGKLWFFVSDSDTPLATFKNEGLTIGNLNPVVADAGGRFSDIWLQMRAYKVRLTDTNDDEIWTADPVIPFIDTVNDNTAYDQPIYMQGMPDDGEIYPRFNIVRPCFLPAGLTSGSFTVEPSSLPTADASILLYKKGFSSIGSITFAPSGAPTVDFPNKISFAPGDQFYPVWPSPQDITFRDVALTFPFTLGS